MERQPENETPPSLIGRTPSHIPPRAGREMRQTNAYFRFLSEIWKVIKGYTAEDISRLKEASISQSEAIGRRQLAEAEEKMAEANARSAKAALMLAEAEKLRAEAYAVRSKAESDYALTRAKAAEALVEAMSRLKAAGGSVTFDLSQIEQLLNQGNRNTPPPEAKASRIGVAVDDPHQS